MFMPSLEIIIIIIIGKPYILRNLQHNTSYVIRVAARTSAGLGEFTHDISQMTQQLKDTSDDGNNATVLNPHSIGILCLIYACSLTLNLVQV